MRRCALAQQAAEHRVSQMRDAARAADQHQHAAQQYEFQAREVPERAVTISNARLREERMSEHTEANVSNIEASIRNQMNIEVDEALSTTERTHLFRY